MNTIEAPTAPDTEGNDGFIWAIGQPPRVAHRAVFVVGQRVRITRGGYSGECGRVRDVHPWEPSGPVYTVTLDTAMLFYGSARCLEVAA